jgi:predicted metal-dependent HD superfamily phosphohydrolase
LLSKWFYELGRHDNEAESAAWAVRELLRSGAGEEMAGRVRRLIMATCHDAAPVSIDARLVVDIDLAILGAPPARFDEYDAQIRAEYAFVPEALFRQRRAQVLQAFLGRGRIFGTPAFVDRFEAAARANLERAQRRLA